MKFPKHHQAAEMVCDQIADGVLTLGDSTPMTRETQ